LSLLILGPMVQLAKCDPLHLGNNCWGHWNMLLFNHVMTKAKIGNSVKTVYQLPETNLLRKYLKVLRFKMKCKRLYNKIVRWFKRSVGCLILSVGSLERRRKSFAMVSHISS
jgi:hypothetical protein